MDACAGKLLPAPLVQYQVQGHVLEVVIHYSEAEAKLPIRTLLQFQHLRLHNTCVFSETLG